MHNASVSTSPLHTSSTTSFAGLPSTASRVTTFAPHSASLCCMCRAKCWVAMLSILLLKSCTRCAKCPLPKASRNLRWSAAEIGLTRTGALCL